MLYVFYKLYRNQPNKLCFHSFAMIQTGTYLYSSTSQYKSAGFNSIRTIFIGNLFMQHYASSALKSYSNKT